MREVCFGHVLGGRKSVMTYWTSSSGVYFEPYPDDFGTWSRNSSHSIGFGFHIGCTEDIVEKKCKSLSGVKLLRKRKKMSIFAFTKLDIIFKFLVFNAVKQGFFFSKERMVGKFLYFTALLLTVQKGFFKTHFSPKAAKKIGKMGGNSFSSV